MSREKLTSRNARHCRPHGLWSGVFVGITALIGFTPRYALAEGSAQLGRISDGGNNGLMVGAELFVDVLAGEDTLNIAARGQGTVGVTVTRVNPDGTLGTSTQHTLTNGNGLLNVANVPATLPSGGNVPLRVGVEPGRYRVVFGEAVEPFDLSVTVGAVSYNPGTVPPNGGRLSAKDWRFFGDLPGPGEAPMNADFFVRASVGEEYEYVWKLQFDGLLGGQMCLTANDLGLPGEFARSSQPFSGLAGFDPGDRFSLCDELSLYDIYVNPPNNRKPEPPTPNLEAFGIGACGAVLEGSGGVFSFDADLEGTYLLVIDVNRDGVFDAKGGDIAFNGVAQAGTNSVAWDGRDTQGQMVPQGDGYAARVFLRLGEFHFTGGDIEALDPGITVARVAPNNSESPTKLYWDDEALAANNFNNAQLAPSPTWSTPNGVNAPHAWRGAVVMGTIYNGPGEDSYIDTWVFGAEQSTDVEFDILSSDDDTDGDGLINGRECVIGSLVHEVDTDGDGVLDGQEERSSNLNDPPTDSDNDGIPDALDDDDDNDGIPTALENPDPNGNNSPEDAQNTDGDDLPDYLDPDDDNDGIPTIDENGDADGNGTPDYLEQPADIADGGVSDDAGNGAAEEVVDSGSDDTVSTQGPVDDSSEQGDSDAGERGETRDSNTSHGDAGAWDADTDSDGDGIPDVDECPRRDRCPDFDNDGVPDYLDADDDGDGVPTRDEDLDGDGDPRNDDTDGDGEPNYLDTDDDGDGILTKFEDIDGDGNPANDDTDGDRKPNYLDDDDDNDGIPTRREHADPNQDGNPKDARDTDGDGNPDYLDDDDDGDGIPTRDEVGTNPDMPRDSDGDGVPDYLQPADERPANALGRAAALKGGGLGCAVSTTATNSTGSSAAFALVALALGAGLFMRRRKSVALGVAASAAIAVIAAPAHAQETSTGFAINRYNPSERGSDWFVGESLDLRGHGRVAAGLVFDWSRKPLVAYDANGGELAAVIDNQVYGHVGFAVNLWERLRLAASFPVLLHQDGTPVEFGGVRYATRDGVEVSDLRLGADLRLFGEYGDAATLAIGAQVTLPTGSRQAYTSDGHARFLPRAALAGDLGIFAYSAQAGLDYRGLRVDYANAPFGTELRFAATMGLRLVDRALLLGPELWGSTVISDHGEGFFEEDTTPFEGIFGAHYFAGDWRFGAGVGPGFTRGLGAPALRVLASIEWFPAIDAEPQPLPPPADIDGDGIIDDEDACVAVPGVPSTDASKHGCPTQTDTDKDGIFDAEDACVTEPGVANEEREKHGCPPDTDGDGVLDRDDACVSEPGPRSSDPKTNGCPASKDTDGDSIIDPQDACPDKAGPASDDPSKHGCPRAEVSGERVVILDRIEFDTNKATIRPESTAILEAVRAVLEENPQIKKVRVEGHTDNRGTHNMNVGLSRRRAEAVVQWLIENGISPERLASRGLGPDKPVDSNDSDAGRQNNRRVEFHIIDATKPGAN